MTTNPTSRQAIDNRDVGTGSADWSAPPPRLTLAARELHIFSFPLDLPPCRIAACAALLAPDEVLRANRFRFMRDRERYIAARGSLRSILGHYTDRPARALCFAYGRFGKPALWISSGEQRVRFNLAGSDDLGLLAVQLDEDLGVDVERLRPFVAAEAIAKRMFAAEEYRILRSLPEAEQLHAFFCYWTRKEAVVKSIGYGLNHPLGSFALSFSPAAGGDRIWFDVDDQSISRWVRPLHPPRPGFLTAVAAERPPRHLRCWSWAGE